MLRSFGYQKTSKVEEFGQYRISGSIIDFFSIISSKPIRINFFEDKIETIKEFDPITQISSNELDEIIICTNAIYNICKNFKPNSKNLKYCITDSRGRILKNSHDLENLINKINWKKL